MSLEIDESKFWQLQLIERKDFTPKLAKFKFEKPTEGSAFKSGQYITFGLERDGKLVQRAYSILSAPHEDFFEFVIELVPDGQLTPKIWELQVGQKIYARKRIVGRFTLAQDAGKTNHLMLATLTGIAPFLSMLRHQKHLLQVGEKPEHRFLLIYGTSYPKDHGDYRDEIDELSKEGWIHFVPTVSRPWEDLSWNRETGRIGDILRKYIDLHGFNAQNTIAYACGNSGMIERASDILIRANFSKEQVRFEKYY